MTEKKQQNKITIFLIWEKHNGVEQRLKTGYIDKKSAYRKVEEWNNREKKEGAKHKYYVREFEIMG